MFEDTLVAPLSGEIILLFFLFPTHVYLRYDMAMGLYSVSNILYFILHNFRISHITHVKLLYGLKIVNDCLF